MMHANPLLGAAQQAHGMAGQSTGRMAMVMTGVSVVLLGVMAFKELKEAWGDTKYKDWEHHNRRHEQKHGTHAERVKHSQGHGHER